MVTATAGVVSAAQPSIGALNLAIAAQSTAQVVTLDQFPVQGLCGFVNSYGAPRSNGRTHEGVDIIAKVGKFVYAVRDGVLTKQYIDKPGSLSGNGWRLTAADGTYFFYAHLSAFGDAVKCAARLAASGYFSSKVSAA